MLALLLGGAAWALSVQLQAEVQPDLRHITGVMEVQGRHDGFMFDPLARLPQPQDDLTLLRTFPGAPEWGEVTWHPIGEDRWAFEVTLPRRYGALGAQGRRGLWANGGWYPQLLVDGQVPVVDWQVELTLPPELVGAVNDQAGQGTLRWEGQAERVAIAALRGRVRELEGGLVVLETGPRRRRRDRELEEISALVLPEPRREQLVVVEAPAYRRLVRPGPGLLYLSDSAFRVPRPLYRVHRGAVARGLAEAGLEQRDPWARELSAVALSWRYQAQAPTSDAGSLMERWSFLPVVDALLYSGRMAFHGELFDETHPSDPLADDLLQLFSPRISGRVLAAKLDDRYGEGSAEALADALLAGHDLEQAARQVGVDPAFIEAWRRPSPQQDLRLFVQRQGEGWQVTVARDAAEDAPPETLRVEIDGGRYAWDAPPGPGSQSWERERRPRRVVVDPEGHVKQLSLLHDRWPTHWTTVGAVIPVSVDLSSQVLVGVATARFRRLYDTRNLYVLTLYTDAQSALGAQASYLYFTGPLQDRRLRPHHLAASLGASWLSPDFSSTVRGNYALEAGLSWTWDTRVSYQYPLQGHRLRVSADGGIAPESGVRWASARGGATWIWSPHPRGALALTGSLGVATGELPHRLLSTSPFRGLSPNAAVAQARASGAAELRTMPLRNLNVPLLWLYWLDEVQLTAGVEALALDRASAVDEAGEIDRLDQRYYALGWTAGPLLTLDGLGAIPWTVGVTAAAPVQGELNQGTRVLLRFGQEF